MPPLIVEGLDEEVRQKLSELARQHGRSPEEEAREILRNAVQLAPSGRAGLGTRISSRFSEVGLHEDIKEMHGFEIKPPSFEP